MTCVKFIDYEGDINYGILVDGVVVCACCGGIFESDEIEILDKWTGDLKETIK